MILGARIAPRLQGSNRHRHRPQSWCGGRGGQIMPDEIASADHFASCGVQRPFIDEPQSKRCGRSSGVEHNLAKVRVEGSNPFARSNLTRRIRPETLGRLRAAFVFLLSVWGDPFEQPVVAGQISAGNQVALGQLDQMRQHVTAGCGQQSGRGGGVDQASEGFCARRAMA